jgi:type I restriction enzyme S subunit
MEIGFAFKSDGFSLDGRGVRLLRGDNIAQGVTRWDRTEFWPANDSVSPRYFLREGDVVLAMDRPWIDAGLKFARIREPDLPAYLVQRVARLRAKEGFDQGYLACVIASKAFTEYILSVQTGTAVPHISGRQILEYRLPRHSVVEQQGIAEVLGALDDKIAANTKLATTTDDFLSNRFLHLLREDCESVRLGDVAYVNARTVKPTSGGQLRYIDIASVSVGSYDFPEPSAWDEAPSRARRAVRRGDTLWSTVRPNRRSHALNLSNDSSLVGSTGLAVMTPRAVGWAYLYEVTKRPEFTAYLETVAEGSAYPAVRADKFEEAPIPLLSEERRQLFESVAEPLRESAHSLSDENRSLASTRDALLPQLMSGKLRVRDAEKVLEGAGV